MLPRGPDATPLDRALACLMGPAAEAEFTGADLRDVLTNTGEQDYEQAKCVLGSSGRDLDYAQEWAVAMVRQHWGAITLLAAALMDRGELSGAQVAALLGRRHSWRGGGGRSPPDGLFAAGGHGCPDPAFARPGGRYGAWAILRPAARGRRWRFAQTSAPVAGPPLIAEGVGSGGGS